MQTAYAVESAGPRIGVAQALLNGDNVLTDGLVHRVIASRLVPDEVPIVERPE